jgi:hypothetical protein
VIRHARFAHVPFGSHNCKPCEMTVLTILFLPIIFCELLELRESDWLQGIGFHHLDGNLEIARLNDLVVVCAQLHYPSTTNIQDTLFQLIPDVIGSEIVLFKKKVCSLLIPFLCNYFSLCGCTHLGNRIRLSYSPNTTFVCYIMYGADRFA